MCMHILDSAFTERILGLSSESYKDYVEADAVQRAKHIEAGSLYLLHGLADISVPYSHSLSLAAALARSSVLFRYQVRKIFVFFNNLYLVEYRFI